MAMETIAKNKINKGNIAVVVPCYNEENTIAKVINDFKAALPRSSIYVVDNCSTDNTASVAEKNGAIVIFEPRKGKGFAIDRILTDIFADYYIMVDGDDTYPAEMAPELLKPVIENKADMTVGTRLEDFSEKSFRPLHVAGNLLVRILINLLFNAHLSDILSGYRAFNRRVVKHVPIVSSGFEVETEMTIQLLYNRLVVKEVPVSYRKRPEGSDSKLSTFRDGFRILWKLFSLSRSVKPVTFFGSIAIAFLIGSLAFGSLPVFDYMTHPEHYVSHVPMAILAASLMLLSFSFVFLGIILHAMNWRFIEMHNIFIRNLECSEKDVRVHKI